jgi:uncharacterized membrane protein
LSETRTGRAMTQTDVSTVSDEERALAILVSGFVLELLGVLAKGHKTVVLVGSGSNVLAVTPDGQRGVQ